MRGRGMMPGVRRSGLFPRGKPARSGWRSSLGRLPNAPVEWPVKTFHAACLHGEMAGNPAGNQAAKRALKFSFFHAHPFPCVQKRPCPRSTSRIYRRGKAVSARLRSPPGTDPAAAGRWDKAPGARCCRCCLDSALPLLGVRSSVRPSGLCPASGGRRKCAAPVRAATVRSRGFAAAFREPPSRRLCVQWQRHVRRRACAEAEPLPPSTGFRAHSQAQSCMPRLD